MSSLGRRDFLRAVAAAWCSAGFVDAVAGGGFSLRYMVASSLYGNLPLRDILPEVSKSGATHLDLWPKVHGTQREEWDAIGHEKFAEMLVAQGIKLGGTTRYDLGPFQLGDEIDLVSRHGGSMIVTSGAGQVGLTGQPLKEGVKNFVKKIKPFADKAADKGVVLAIENHGKNMINSPDSLRWLAEFGGPGLGIAFAPYHLPQDEAIMAGLIRDIGPKLALFYAWQYGNGCMKAMPKEEELQQMPGRGSLDFKPLLMALQEVKFAGFTEIFMHPTPRGIPILETAPQVTGEINAARAYLAKLLS